MRGVITGIACALVLVGCGGGGAIPEHTAMPIQTVNEPTDEWLHDRCEVKNVARLGVDEIEPKAISAGSNFVEVLYRDQDGVGVVMFACKETPPNAE